MLAAGIGIGPVGYALAMLAAGIGIGPVGYELAA